jgi:hypothetical protein
MNRKDVEAFFKTLILGDFEENQNFAGQIVGGVISLIPIVDQVMDARDISGALYRINNQGGFNNATTNQLVNLGFAAFGAVPEVGSAFKTVFKPMWKERQAVKGAVNGGLQAVERMLGQKKGGTIVWVRMKVLGQWANLTSQAIVKVNVALAACIELLDTIGHLKGWKDYLVPDSIQALALELLPSLRSMQSGVTKALQRAAAEIHHFLEDLLGEQAATVVMAVGQRAVAASAVPGTRTRSGHNAAALKPREPVPQRQGKREIGGRPAQDAGKGAGRMHAVVRVTANTIKTMANQEKGLVGEHMADYFETKRLGGSWTHDELKSKWSPASVRKLNVDKRPVNLRLIDLPKVNQAGLDAVWQHGEQYTVTEAKARASIGSAYGVGKMLVKNGRIPDAKGLTPDQELLHYLLSDYEDKGRGGASAGAGMMQMGIAWTRDRGGRETGVPTTARRAIDTDLASRRVVLVSFESQGALDHAEALIDINLGKPDAQVHPHTDHGITRAWDKAAINAVDRAREKARKPIQASSAKPSKSSKPAKSKK